MKIGIDLGGSHIGVGLIEGVELKETADVFFTQEDRNDIENSILYFNKCFAWSQKNRTILTIFNYY